MLALRNIRARQLWLAPFCFCVGLAGSGCGSDSTGNTDAPVLSPADAPLADATPADAAADLASAQPDLVAPDAPATGAEVAGPDLGSGSVDESAQEAGAAPLDALVVPDSGGVAIDGSGPDGGVAAGSDGSTANPACSSLVNPVFILTGDTQVPVVRQVGKVLRAQPDPTTLVWFATGSCSIFDAFYNGGNMTANGSFIPADPNWDAKSGAVPTCTIPAGGLPPDLGIPIGFASGCGYDGPPAGYGVIKGPVQSFVFVVPTASIASAISAEEAYLVFGFGQAGGVAPWTNEDFYFVRPPSKGTQVSLGFAINVPAAKWKGKRIDKSNDVASGVATATSPDQAIGILGTEIYDSAANRAVLRTLTLQAYKQEKGYLPDSAAAAFDKRNVRDGHYIPWSHVFYLTPVDATGAPTKPRVRPIVDAFTGGPSAAALGIDTIALTANNGIIPACAMTVQRSAEAGEQSPYVPPTPCGCAFEAAVGKAPAACVPCTSDSTCTGGTHCWYGYCEAPDGRTSLSDCTAPSVGDPLSIINGACAGRLTSPKRPMPQKQIDNGGVLPPLP